MYYRSLDTSVVHLVEQRALDSRFIMQITYLGHASILIEAGGLRILSDPWWRGPCFGAQWWIYPEPYLDPVLGKKLDYIYISHGHEDHFHPGTLKTLDRSVRVLAARGTDLVKEVRSIGFEVLEVDAKVASQLGGGVQCRIVPTLGGDTFMTLSDGKEVVVNLNDALHALPRYVRKRFIAMIRDDHPSIDYVFCGYGVASHFPNCYVMPGKDREASAQKRQLFFNQAWADIIHELAPQFGFPFAADVVLLENDLFWANEAVHNTERPTQVFERLFPGARTQVMDIAPGFCIGDGNVESMRTRKPLDGRELSSRYRDNIARANRNGTVRYEQVQELQRLLEERIRKIHRYLTSFPRDYRVLMQFRNSDMGLAVTKERATISVYAVRDVARDLSKWDLTYRTRLPYLLRSLTTEHGSDILFVGSGGVFEYANQSMVPAALHEELMLIVSPSRVPGSRTSRRLKSWLRRAVNRDDFDLYNLRRWTLLRDESLRSEANSSLQSRAGPL